MTTHLRHNVRALGADYALFLIGLSFASPSTILPAFAVYLGAPNVMIGTSWHVGAAIVLANVVALGARFLLHVRSSFWSVFTLNLPKDI